MPRLPRQNRRRLFLEPLEERVLLAADLLAGGLAEGEDPPLVNIRLEVTDLNGNAISTIDPGEQFFLNKYVQDLRSTSEGMGVFAIYADVVFAANLVDVMAAPTFACTDVPAEVTSQNPLCPAGPLPPTHDSIYKNGRSFDTATDGVIDEWGAFDGIDWLTNAEYPVSSVKMKAQLPGDVLFSSNQADDVPDHDVLLFNLSPPVVPSAQIVFGTASLHINSPPVIIDDGDATGYTQTNGWTNVNRATSYGGTLLIKCRVPGMNR